MFTPHFFNKQNNGRRDTINDSLLFNIYRPSRVRVKLVIDRCTCEKSKYCTCFTCDFPLPDNTLYIVFVCSMSMYRLDKTQPRPTRRPPHTATTPRPSQPRSSLQEPAHQVPATQPPQDVQQPCKGQKN